MAEESESGLAKNIQVALRFRPLNEREKRSESGEVFWQIEDKDIFCNNQRIGTPTGFTFDHVFGPDVMENGAVYDNVVKESINAALEGINATIFAYGQTSAGKTFTMIGNESNPGLILRALSDLFSHTSLSVKREYSFRVSYMEIYNENIVDLLNPQNNNLKIHESLTRGIFVGNLAEEPVCNLEQALEVLKKGEEARHFGETNMNERSSRSHCLFRITIESREATLTSNPDKLRESTSGPVRVSVLTFADLAGSEKARITGAEGQRLKEGGHINKSLLALTSVISKLADGGERAHIPYRDSKITRILQSSLGGNSSTSIICAATPATEFFEETLSTLKFASRAKNIKTKPRINEIASDYELLKRTMIDLEETKAQLVALTMSSKITPLKRQQTINLNEKALSFETYKSALKQVDQLKDSLSLISKELTNSFLSLPAYIQDLKLALECGVAEWKMSMFLQLAEFQNVTRNLISNFSINKQAVTNLQLISNQRQEDPQITKLITEQNIMIEKLRNENHLLRERSYCQSCFEISSELAELGNYISSTSPLCENFAQMFEDSRKLCDNERLVVTLRDKIKNREDESSLLLEKIHSLQAEHKFKLENLNDVILDLEKRLIFSQSEYANIQSDIIDRDQKIADLQSLYDEHLIKTQLSQDEVQNEISVYKESLEEYKEKIRNLEFEDLKKIKIISELQERTNRNDSSLNELADSNSRSITLIVDLNEQLNIKQKETEKVEKEKQQELEASQILRSENLLLVKKCTELEALIVFNLKSEETRSDDIKASQPSAEVILRIELEKIRASHAKEIRLLQLKVDNLEEELSICKIGQYV